jgi:AcrR family transcriptional regulator
MTETDSRFAKAEEQILTTFTELLKKQDFQSLSINQLTKIAGIHRSTFYAHYLDKEDLLRKYILNGIHIRFAHALVDANIFSQAFAWQLLVQTRETLDELKETFGSHYKSIAAIAESTIVKYLEETFDDIVRDSKLNDHSGYIDYVAILTSASIFALASESSKRKQDVNEISDYFRRMNPIHENTKKPPMN